MVFYLIFCSLLIPINLWAAITPHLHSLFSMKVLHGVSTLILLPLIASLWTQRRHLDRLISIILFTFLSVMVVINSSIAIRGMGVKNGWIVHLFLCTRSCECGYLFLIHAGTIVRRQQQNDNELNQP